MRAAFDKGAAERKAQQLHILIEETSMKTVSKFLAFTLLLLAVAYCSAGDKATTPPANLVRGAVGPFTANSSWAGYSVVTLIPGASLIPVTSTQTVLYLGFAAGSESDITNMVLYTTARGSTTITAVTPVTYKTSSSPSIMLSSTSVCPTQPLSATSVCVVRLDPMSIVLSATNDYYFAVYFTANDGNNGSMGSPQDQYPYSALRSWYVGSTNDTNLTVGESIPSNTFENTPFFLTYVMTD
jgi:hypothetical protein